MKRVRQSKPKANPDLIITSDWHLREDTPKCRTDDFEKTQWDKIVFISDLQKKYDCPVFHAGDLFNHWKPSPYLLSCTMLHLPKKFYSIYGQHDLPQHNIDLFPKTGLNVLEQASFVEVWVGCPFGLQYDTTKNMDILLGKKRVTMLHKLIWENKPPHWAKDDMTALEVLKEYPFLDLIITGDNHSSFIMHYEGRLLVNPGAITRQNADEGDRDPCVYLWYAESNTAEPVFLPIESGVISREHIEQIEKRDARIEAFIEKLNTDWKAEISFEMNLEIFEKKNKIDKSVMQIVREVCEG